MDVGRFTGRSTSNVKRPTILQNNPIRIIEKIIIS